MEEINIEQIMQEIRDEIKEKGYKESDLSFNDIAIKEQVNVKEEYDSARLEELLRFANVSTRVDFYKPIIGNGPKAIMKKAIRKIIKPIVLPLCQEQEKYNATMIQIMNQMQLYIQLQEKRIKELEEIIVKRES